ncbi:hypothetical protein D3C86_1172870 [compost metagenome]
MKILQKFYRTRENKDSNNQLYRFKVEERFDEIIHQHHHENVAQIGSHEKPIFKFCSDEHFYQENGDGNEKVF